MPKQKQKRPTSSIRTRAAVLPRRGYEKIYESDSAYFLKLVMYVLIGMLWLRLEQPITWLGLPIGAIPLGLLIGLLLVRRFEKYQSDRKIWYAILLVVAITSNFFAAGIVV